MDAGNDFIYGLELQARSLTANYGENNNVSFLIATNSLKSNNQVHLLKFKEDSLQAESEIFEHGLGEVWSLRSSASVPRLIATCSNTIKGGQVISQGAVFTLPESGEIIEESQYIPAEKVTILPTEAFGSNVKTIEFNPININTLACVVDSTIVLFDQNMTPPKIIAEITSPDPKNVSHITKGKWSQHCQGNQFITTKDCCVHAFDVRDIQNYAWKIEKAHSQLIRDIDCNPNKQCHIVTGGDDSYLKIWDYRMTKKPIFSCMDHSHWIWCVRFNSFHDQLILSSSSDCKIMLTSAGSVSSEQSAVKQHIHSNSSRKPIDTARRILPDGLLQSFDQHEDSVYSVEWSNVDPWTFASLSYDGRVMISKIPKLLKYHLIL